MICFEICFSLVWANRRRALFFFAAVSARRGRRSCRVVRAAVVPAAALVGCSYGGPSLASSVLPPSRYRCSLLVPCVGSLFPLVVYLFVPIIFPRYGDLWGSYGWGLPTLSDVKFQLGFVGLVFDNHCVPCSYGLSFLPYAWWPVFFC